MTGKGREGKLVTGDLKKVKGYKLSWGRLQAENPKCEDPFGILGLSENNYDTRKQGAK